MADERDEEREDGPKIRIVDRRMLSDEERTGKVSTSNQPSTPPKLEIVGGGSAAQTNPSQMPDTPAETPPASDEIEEPGPYEIAPVEEPDDEEPMSAEEMEQMREQVELEQFAALEEQVGRPLTEAEKDRVRLEMDKQARSMAALEVAPILQRTLADISSYAAVHMGLMPNPYTRLIAKNDAEARMAIDAFGALFEVLKPKLDPSLAREYARVLNDLRVNYATQTGTPIIGGAGGSPFGGGTGGPRIIH